ncbi:hypothetical protein CCACVL1_12969 [Corchorus capsularis]|uniref:Uncharacterized protein n=1 Tax=Corchorus capsularis TaxID=210143 RepID=A0A1R3ICY9_COCAP|nr:hypothetical protein CCACVL1_12969 [Corchorus capsularis]
MDVSEGTIPDLPQAMDTSETGVSKPDSGAVKIKMKKGRPMKRSKNVRKMKSVAKAIAKNEQYAEKTTKSESKKSRTQSAKSLYD